MKRKLKIIDIILIGIVIIYAFASYKKIVYRNTQEKILTNSFKYNNEKEEKQKKFKIMMEKLMLEQVAKSTDEKKNIVFRTFFDEKSSLAIRYWLEMEKVKTIDNEVLEKKLNFENSIEGQEKIASYYYKNNEKQKSILWYDKAYKQGSKQAKKYKKIISKEIKKENRR